MRSKLLSQEGGNTYALIFDTGDEVMSLLTDFAREHQMAGAHFTAIGAFREVTLAYFDWEKKEYEEIPVNEQVEVLTLTGDIAWGDDGDPTVHAHVVLGNRTGKAIGGHLKKATVRPTLELILTESPAHLRRKHDPVTGLALIRV